MEQLALDLPAALGEPWRYCARCISLGRPGYYPTAFFRIRVRSNSNPGRIYYAKVCLGCEDELEPDRLLKSSLAQRIRHHAKRAGIELKVYRDRYGLHTDAVVAWFKARWSSGELDCGCPTEVMNHGWRDAELDQHNPEAEPFFPDNWRLYCSVHNNSKGRSDPDTFAARQRGWALFREAAASPERTF